MAPPKKQEKVSKKDEPKEESAPQESAIGNNNANNNTATSVPDGGAATTTEDAAAAAGADATTTTSQRRRPPSLWKSPRLKGYLTLVLASIINYNAAYHSNDAIYNNAISASPTQQRYAMAVSLVSTIVSAVAIIAHLDRYSPLQHLWRTIFQPKSRFELVLLLLILVWWCLATGIQTSIRGLAGDGKGQYNLYFSTWVCALTSIWMVERWWVTFGWSSFTTFLSSWPYRSPGWMAMTFMSLFTLIWYVDLYHNWRQAPQKNGVLLLYQKVTNAQWEWLLFITGFTSLPGLVFVLIELFRETAPSKNDNNNENNNPNTPNTANNNDNNDNNNNSPPRDGTRETPGRYAHRRFTESAVVRTISNASSEGKGEMENVTEGLCLLVLVVAWVPSVVIATSPGGIASLVGNSYFFTWATSVFVTETTIWWIHDWRKNIHSALTQQAREYHQKQLQVLKKSHQIQQRAAVAAAHAVAARNPDSDDDVDDDNDDDIEEHKVEEGAISGRERRGTKRERQVSERTMSSSRTDPESSQFFDALEEITDGL